MEILPSPARKRHRPLEPSDIANVQDHQDHGDPLPSSKIAFFYSQRIQQLEKEITQLHAERAELTSERQALRNHIASSTNKLPDECSGHPSEAQIRSYWDEIAKLRADKDQLVREKLDLLQSQNKDVAELEKQLNEKENQNRQLQSEIEQLQKIILEKDSILARSEAIVRQHESVRRALHNELLELKGNIRVFCRSRPLLSSEKEAAEILFLEDGASLEIANPSQKEAPLNKAQKACFKFDRVFQPQESQENVFLEISQLVQSAMDGYKVCIFAYGQTGSGKTHTMEGLLNKPAERGMIPRAVDQIFATKTEMERRGWEFELCASFMEIYNDNFRDLLAAESGDLKYELKQDGELMYVTNMTVVPVPDPAVVMSLLATANRHRTTATTNCNERSSRSHSIFSLRITATNEGSGVTQKGVLELVDLAGSERVKVSGAEGLQMKEATHINKSLSALGDVIAAIQSKRPHIPYRNSKLTHYLSPCLGGQSKCLMFVNVSPVADSYVETVCSLKFASKVNACEIGRAKKTVMA